MTYTELQERCKGRNFDRITVVTRDIFPELANLSKLLEVTPGDIRIVSEASDPGLTLDGREQSYTEYRASIFFLNTELCVVQPIKGDTVYARYLERFGEGICCVRERVRPDDFDRLLEGFAQKGLAVPQRQENPKKRAAWLDLCDEMGILFELISDDSERLAPTYVCQRRISQINVTTPDVRKTIERISELLEIGPWEVGRQNNSTVRDPGFRVDGQLIVPEFEFLVAILVCGNLEWEVIQPVKGPLVYCDFLKRHGIGYHHILIEVPQSRWDEVKEGYRANGIALASQGSIGPIDWCYMDTEKELGFYMELRTDAQMDRLPDGYLAYFYPEQD